MKYLKMLLKLKSVAEVYQEEKGTGKPWYLSRRLIGVVLLAAAYGANQLAGIIIPDEMVNSLAGYVSDAIEVAIGLYGAIMVIVGQIKRQKNVG